MKNLHDSTKPDDPVEHLLLREQWAQDITWLMFIVLTVAAVVITVGIIFGLFSFGGSLLIYPLWGLGFMSWWGAKNAGWRWARYIPSSLCFGLGCYITYIAGFETIYVMFFALAVLLTGMLFQGWPRWLVTGLSIAAYTFFGLNRGAVLVDSFDQIVTFSASILGVLLLQNYYQKRIENALAIQVASNQQLTQEMARRAQAEASLQERSAQLQRLAENTTDLISEIDMDGKLHYATPSYTSVLGYSIEELAEISPYSLVHSDDLPKILEFMRRIEETGKPQSVEVLARHRNDYYIPFEIWGSPLYEKGDAISGVVLSGRDISRQKTVEAALQASESKFRTIIESLPLGVFIYALRADGELVFTGYNQAAEAILGISLAPLLGKPIEIAIPGFCNTEIPDQFRKIAGLGGLWKNESFHYQDHLVSSIFEMHAFQTSPGSVVAVVMNVTERIRAAEALRQSEKKFSNAFFTSPDSIIILRLADNTFIDVNNGFTQLTGYTAQETIGKTTLELNIWAHKEEQERLVKGLKERGVVDNMPATFRRKNGEQALGLMSATLVTINDETCVLTIARDMTGQLEAQRVLQSAHDQLEEAYDLTLVGWARALELRERETASHSRRVVDLTLQIARAAGLSEEEMMNIQRGALLHDIGKLGVPDHVLLKPGPLTSEEWTLMREHPLLGKKLLIDIPYLQSSIDIPYGHHEHWDGSGYPLGLRGEEIPLAARIFSVVDVWDALISDRPYRRAWSQEDACEYIRAQSGRLFDPRIVDLFLQNHRRIYP